MPEITLNCERCGYRQASHRGSEYMCCECFVRSGHAPADWHRMCMATYHLMRAEARASESRTPE